MDDQPKVSDKAAGPGAIDIPGESPAPLLEGASEYEYIEILNPLSVEFIGQFGLSKAANTPIKITTSREAPGVTKNEEDVRRNYGLDLNNPDHRGTVHIINKVNIQAGKTIRLLGNEAQVVVNQLVTEIMQRNGDRLLLADPFARNQVEKTIIMSRGYLQDILGSAPVSIQDQLKNALDKESNGEQTFPDINQSESTVPTSTGAVQGTTDNTVSNAGSTSQPTTGEPESSQNSSDNSRSRNKAGQFVKKTANG